MSGVYATIEAQGLSAAVAALNALGSGRARELLPQVGGLVESQTRERFQSKTGPDGAPWAPWSAAYAKSRRRGQSLLVAEGHLRDSIEWRVEGDAVHIGSNLVYAAIQQAGGREGMRPGPAAIPARPYLGVSDANAAEISAEIEAWVRGIAR